MTLGPYTMEMADCVVVESGEQLQSIVARRETRVLQLKAISWSEYPRFARFECNSIDKRAIAGTQVFDKDFPGSEVLSDAGMAPRDDKCPGIVVNHPVFRVLSFCRRRHGDNAEPCRKMKVPAATDDDTISVDQRREVDYQREFWIRIFPIASQREPTDANRNPTLLDFGSNLGYSP